MARRPSNDTGTRPVSMADVARAAGVSQQTVSRVANGLPNVNEQTRQRVQAAMQELGFRPSYAGRSLRDGRYHSVGLCVNDVTKFGNLSMIDGIASAAREHNCAITLVEMSKTEEFSLAEATRRMAALPVDGIIIGHVPYVLASMGMGFASIGVALLTGAGAWTASKQIARLSALWAKKAVSPFWKDRGNKSRMGAEAAPLTA